MRARLALARGFQSRNLRALMRGAADLDLDLDHVGRETGRRTRTRPRRPFDFGC